MRLVNLDISIGEMIDGAWHTIFERFEAVTTLKDLIPLLEKFMPEAKEFIKRNGD